MGRREEPAQELCGEKTGERQQTTNCTQGGARGSLADQPRVGEFDFDAALQVEQLAVTNNGMSHVKAGAKVRIWQGRDVFDYGSTVDHGVMFQGSAACNHGGSANPCTGADEGGAQDAGTLVNLRSAAKPYTWLDLVTLGRELNSLH
jgi:hypothetical protein